MAVSPDGSTLYVVDAVEGVVAAMDAATLETRVVDDLPFGMDAGVTASAQVSSDGRALFVTASGSSTTLFALDAATFEIAGRWALEDPVTGLGLSSDGDRLYAASSQGLVIVDPLSGVRLADVPVPIASPVVRISSLGG
jgi:DNA-binding beta-propeller fold protein YncE